MERPFSLGLWSPSSARGGCGSCPVPTPSHGFPGCLPSRQGMSVSSFGLSVGPYLCHVLKVLVRSLYRGSFYVTWKFLDARRTCRVAFPPGGCRSLPSGLDARSVRSFWFLVERFPCQVTSLPPSPCLVWISRHAPRPSFESLTPKLCLVSPSPPSRFVGARVLDLLCSSVCRLHCTDRPNTSTIAWDTIRFSRAVRFSLPVSAPHRLHCGRLFFPAALI